MLKKYQKHDDSLRSWNGGSGGGEMAKEAMAYKREWEREERGREEGNMEEEEADMCFNDLYIFFYWRKIRQ